MGTYYSADFSIPTNSLLLVFLKYSRHLREFCGFTKVPDASKITRFKQDFLLGLQSVFNNLVDVTEPICQALDSAKADMTIFDSSGIEAWVMKNNPKFANRIIKQLKTYAKANHFNSRYGPYKAAYSSMPTHTSANNQIKQLYVDGHFCYAYKIGIVTNGLGIVRHLEFYNRDFLESHPELIQNKKSDSPDEDKSVHDAKLLIPIKCECVSKLRSGVPRCKFVCPKIIWAIIRKLRVLTVNVLVISPARILNVVL